MNVIIFSPFFAMIILRNRDNLSYNVRLLAVKTLVFLHCKLLLLRLILHGSLSLSL
jgi:hypothetical protein